MTQIISFLCIGLLGFIPLSAQNTKVYVAAHPDDWQLFMNPNAYKDLQNPENKVIFLHTTAGDAGCGTGCISYYKAREEGSLRAIRLMCNAINNQLKQGDDMNKTHVLINGHSILRYSYANAVAYFLRLPDGNYTGVGYPLHNHSSLKYFYEGSVPELIAIDQSTAYQSLDDLVTTLSELLNYESNGLGQVSLNIAETNAERNPEDHSDHLHSSFIMQQVARSLGLESVRLYEEYATNKKPINVVDADFLMNAGVWGATASGLSDHYHNSTWDEGHNAWLGRQYFREVLLSDLEND
ncbi:GlcNAc-PI de-N-acetylase [Flavobacteriaceae bacterium MAR_2010_72]|nr:GlcNAc-PI de-N-acetylase [Flavobacteriaceae bacterium MAR_2010_72]